MKRAHLLLPILLAGCNSGPSVTAENATANEVDAKLAQSGGAQFLSPGHWDSVITVHDIQAPGMPPSAAAQMKTMLNKPTSDASCLTPEEAKKPAGSFFAGGDDSDCRYDHFSMTGGAIDAMMTCKDEHANQTVALKGSYSADTFHLDMTTKSNGAGPMANMTMAMTVDAKRTGACTGKEDDADDS